MERLTVFQTDKGRYSVRPIDWEGIWDKQGKIQEKGFNHTGIFQEKEDAEFFARTKNLEEEGKLLKLPCNHGDYVWFIKSAFSRACFPIKAKVVYVRVCSNGDIHYSAITEYNGISRAFYKSQIGGNVFLTEQEAKEALERIKK